MPVALSVTLAWRALGWVLPWELHDYPGREHGVSQLLQGRVKPGTVRQWRNRDRMPAWARVIVADYIEARCRAGLAIVDELRAVVDPPRPLRGFCVVGKDGRDKRGRVGKRRAKSGDAPDVV